jgi:hypothetical protein
MLPAGSVPIRKADSLLDSGSDVDPILDPWSETKTGNIGVGGGYELRTRGRKDVKRARVDHTCRLNVILQEHLAGNARDRECRRRAQVPEMACDGWLCIDRLRGETRRQGSSRITRGARCLKGAKGAGRIQ